MGLLISTLLLISIHQSWAYFTLARYSEILLLGQGAMNAGGKYVGRYYSVKNAQVNFSGCSYVSHGTPSRKKYTMVLPPWKKKDLLSDMEKEA